MGEKICGAHKGETSEHVECLCVFVFVCGQKQGCVRSVAIFSITGCVQTLQCAAELSGVGGQGVAVGEEEEESCIKNTI